MATRLEIEQTAFLYGGNGGFIEDLYSRYLDDPETIDESWRAYFDELGAETRPSCFGKAKDALERSAPAAPVGGCAGRVRRCRT